ncbi:hypothetical protein EVAR_68599_1 [Eumeta japonica]|uniref:Uncharacterized protein n=1 Tax=Eumeta variegata TaxID=151549 RepID=A0A4C1ZNV2_EUMVA|nr:hypothetical protein EVAR_68599_1 [Eumeta japonica]
MPIVKYLMSARSAIFITSLTHKEGREHMAGGRPRIRFRFRSDILSRLCIDSDKIAAFEPVHSRQKKNIRTVTAMAYERSVKAVGYRTYAPAIAQRAASAVFPQRLERFAKRTPKSAAAYSRSAVKKLGNACTVLGNYETIRFTLLTLALFPDRC